MTSPQRKAPNPAVPPLADHERLRLEMHRCVERAAGSLIDFAERAAEFVAKQYHVRYGCEDARAYFDRHGPVSWRTCQKALSVWEGLCRLPDPERALARPALAAIGSHKATVLAPLLGQDGQDWRRWVAFAQEATEEALQEAVSEARGARPRGTTVAAEERFLNVILGWIPPECREQVTRVFGYGQALGNTRNNIAIFLYMIAEVEAEWQQQVSRKSDQT